MKTRLKKLAVTALGAALLVPASLPGARAQSSVAASESPMKSGPLGRDAAADLMPQTVFFAGKTAPVQGRNTAGARLPGGLVLAGLVDSSGYSTAIQERYQAYLLLDTPALFGGRLLRAGAYGCGVVGADFVVLDLGSNELFHVPVVRDTALVRPTPLQVISDPKGGAYRLYFGRSFVVFASPGVP